MSKVNQYNTKNLYFSNRVTNDLNEIINHPLTIIEAPMGYGKTTSVKEYLQNSKVNILWQRIYDNSINSFWNSFAKLFRDLDEDCFQGLAQIGLPDDIISIQEAIKLIEDINLPNETVIVIDDYHLVECSEVNNFIEFFAENEIDNLYIVLIVRYTKFQKLEELILKSCLYHITKETFELMPKEIIAYYRTCGISLSDSEAQKLYINTEGWISALYLFMMEYVSKGSYTPEKSIYKLIEKTVYLPLSDQIKQFLVTMCIFDSFTLNQSRYIWGNDNASEFLDEITSNNCFITYDSEFKVYNIHSIFTGFLRDVFEEKEITFKQNLYQKSAQWFMKHSDYITARSYFYKYGDFDNILLSIEMDKSNNFTIENKELLKKYMEACPEAIKSKHPYAVLIYAIYLFIFKEFELFRKLCGIFTTYIEGNKDLKADKRNQLLGELELLLSFDEFNDLKKMSIRQQKAWKLMNQPTSMYNTSTNWTFGNPSVLCLYYRDSGKLHQHIKDLKNGLAYYYLLTNGHGSGGEYTMEAEDYFNQGDFENAEISVHKALLKAQEGKEQNILLSAEYLQIRIAFMKGDLSLAMQLFNKRHEIMTSKKDFRFSRTIEMCEGYIYAYFNQEDKIPQRLLEIEHCKTCLNFPAYVFFNIIYGRVLLIKGEYLKLIGSAEYFISIASVFSNQLGYIYTYIYLAASYKKIHREDEAILNLKKALEIAMPDKQYMIFVENCDYIKEILEKIAIESYFKEDIKKVLALYKTYKKYKEQIISQYFIEEKNKLTQREIEIAQLAAVGITNIEIGKQLYISPNTVKKALNSIYVKLSINNRTLLQQHLNKIDK